MIVRKGLRYRLYPDDGQVEFFRRIAGCCRFVANLGLEQRRAFSRPGRRIGYHEQRAELAALKEAAPFLKDVPHHCLQEALVDLQAAFDRFFKGLAKHPTPRKKLADDRFRFPDPKQFRIDAERGLLILPKMGKRAGDRGAIRIRLHRPVEGRVTAITIRREGDWWMASLHVEVEVPDPAAPPGEPIAADLGTVCPVACSDGTFPWPRRPTDARTERRLRRLQRAAARKKRGSRNRDKALRRVARLKARQARRRLDALHKTTTHLAKNHRLIAVEDLKVRAMTASARGTEDEPGRNVAQKAGLNRAMLDVGFGAFRGLLEYKARWYGSTVVAVPPAYSSQTCGACGHAHAENRATRDQFACLACGHAEHADVNAAKVILRRALNILKSTGEGPSLAACGALCASMAAKQEGPGASLGSPAL